MHRQPGSSLIGATTRATTAAGAVLRHRQARFQHRATHIWAIIVFGHTKVKPYKHFDRFRAASGNGSRRSLRHRRIIGVAESRPAWPHALSVSKDLPTCPDDNFLSSAAGDESPTASIGTTRAHFDVTRWYVMATSSITIERLGQSPLSPVHRGVVSVKHVSSVLIFH